MLLYQDATVTVSAGLDGSVGMDAPEEFIGEPTTEDASFMISEIGRRGVAAESSPCAASARSAIAWNRCISLARCGNVTMSVMDEQRARSRSSFTDEFKRDAVALVFDEDRRSVDVTRSPRCLEGARLEIGVRQARIDGTSGPG